MVASLDARPHETCRPRPDARAAAARLLASGGERAALGVVLGTGLGGLADRLDRPRSIDSAATGWLANSTATGHAGRIVFGAIAGLPIVALQGRVHAYEGVANETLSRGVELLAALGATTLLVTNAAGGLRPDMRGGELVVVNDHLDFVARPWAAELECAGHATVAPRRSHAGPWYDTALVERALRATRGARVPARAGVYAYLLGPSYETRAEYRMLQRLGADAVGMSTVPEVVAARRMGLAVSAVSVVTNVARPDALEATDAEEVCRVAGTAAEGVWAILESLAGSIREGTSP
ncbi:MAG: purine-nucleoside phosphorylase [Planctomycetia bacterium]|jgi:purine-nucleoside phosphorylase